MREGCIERESHIHIHTQGEGEMKSGRERTAKFKEGGGFAHVATHIEYVNIS